MPERLCKAPATRPGVGKRQLVTAYDGLRADTGIVFGLPDIDAPAGAGQAVAQTLYAGRDCPYSVSLMGHTSCCDSYVGNYYLRGVSHEIKTLL